MPIQKTCPRCGTTHTKRGAFCSQSCGNVRVHTEEDKKIRSKKLLEYHQTPEGAATREKSSRISSAMKKVTGVPVIVVVDVKVVLFVPVI